MLLRLSNANTVQNVSRRESNLQQRPEMFWIYTITLSGAMQFEVSLFNLTKCSLHEISVNLKTLCKVSWQDYMTGKDQFNDAMKS